MTEPRKKSGKPLIMSVDDDPRIQKIIELYLAKNGYDAVFAANGEEALRKLADVKPDLVLLDVMMPGMGGYEVCAKIQEDKDTAYIPVIFATALSEERDKARAFAAGAADYLVKPIKKDDLLEKIKANLKTRDDWSELSRREETPAGAGVIGKYDYPAFQEFFARQLGLDDAAGKAFGKAPAPELYEAAARLGVKGETVAQLIAERLKLPFLAYLNPNDVKLGVLPTRFCRTNRIVALADAGAGTAFALSNPFDWQLEDVLRRFAEQGQKFRIMITEPENVHRILEAAEGPAPETAAKVKAAADKAETPAFSTAGFTIEVVKEESTEANEEAAASQAPVIKLANELLARAAALGASDLHVEPRQHCLGIRYRVDGVLQEHEPIPHHLGPAVISRLKIISSLDIANRRVPQDGRVAISYKGRNLELRVSTLPSRYGEKVVIRFADPSALSLDFESLGFMGDQLAAVQESIKKPHGIILVTGPTGSGKTTTLYTALQALNDPDKNIVTVEDPIENELHRVTQVQVRPETGMTFPAALRSILRQDPDIIMIGEIRDLDTAAIAVKAALTGHLVLSTLHTNDAPSTLIRLVDMGIDAFLVTSAIEMVLAQRLLRKLCPNCKQPVTPGQEDLEKFGRKIEKGMEFFEPKGCAQCGNTGYKGRIAILEILTMDPGMRELFLKNAGPEEIRRHAVSKLRMIELRQDGFLKAALGLTSFAEVLRVTA